MHGTQLLSGLAAALALLPLAANAACNVHFYSESNCQGTSTASCVPDFAANEECTWNTWVGSIYYESCGDDELPSFVGCNGDPGACHNAWSLGVPDTASGCVEIGTYDGKVTTYDVNDPTCVDCIGSGARVTDGDQGGRSMGGDARDREGCSDRFRLADDVQGG
ncbi:hypothetical protein BO82DRAFT_369859 [Aspergillus uvarum CBS 121591]|uniref:Uncharacterized protein n=1 Tax=Aspergillus uvarum CBS 121591 TaxID=1448315 RepID=A0A319BT40_9EURO|nr:hypothetical protein BO82DRAFT_369859 [Aspergillus uvarum CBS 121591]PYH75865.1 hypothetical protein BO82DRAFT_369859 [Aspergillus uvarum CBS 121591]